MNGKKLVCNVNARMALLDTIRAAISMKRGPKSNLRQIASKAWNEQIDTLSAAANLRQTVIVRVAVAA